MKPGKTRRKGFEGKRKHYNKADHHQNLPRTANVAERGGGQTNKGAIEGKRRRYCKETNVETLPRTAIHCGGVETKSLKPTRNGKVAQPTVPRGGEVPS